MNQSGEAAEQIVRMSLNGVEVAAKLTGKGTLKLASILLKEMSTNKHSKGRQRMASMLKSGSALKVYPIRDEELTKFAREAKKYGIPYCVMKDRDANDGVTDIMVRADDDSKINRIFERFELSKVSSATIQTEIERKKSKAGEISVTDKSAVKSAKEDDFIEQLMKKPSPNSEKNRAENPTHGGTAKTSQSVPSSDTTQAARGTDEDSQKRPSVRKELSDIRRELDRKNAAIPRGKAKTHENVHKEIKKKIKKKER